MSILVDEESLLGSEVQETKYPWFSRVNPCDPNNPDYVDFGAAPDFQLNDYTACVWVFPKAFLPDNSVVWGSYEDGLSPGYTLRISNTGNPQYFLWNNNPNFGQCLSPFSIPLDAWTHLAVSFDTTNGQSLFVNGIEVATDNYLGVISSWTNHFQLARQDRVNAARRYQGVSRDLIIYNRNLTLLEVFDVFLENPPASGLVDRIEQTDGSGFNVSSESGNNDGTVSLNANSDINTFWASEDEFV